MMLAAVLWESTHKPMETPLTCVASTVWASAQAQTAYWQGSLHIHYKRKMEPAPISLCTVTALHGTTDRRGFSSNPY